MIFRGNYRVVGFEVETQSIHHSALKFDDGGKCILPSSDEYQQQEVTPGRTSLYFSYSVQWQESDVSWASRWDIYLGMADVQIHWFSIINSLVVVLFLSGLFIFFNVVLKLYSNTIDLQ